VLYNNFFKLLSLALIASIQIKLILKIYFIQQQPW